MFQIYIKTKGIEVSLLINIQNNSLSVYLPLILRVNNKKKLFLTSF
jgi:hypothetical protein